MNQKEVVSRLTALGATLALLAVAVGAFGAHALKARLQATNMQQVYETGVQYHMYHALGILVTALFAQTMPANKKLFYTAGLLFAVGILLFSGSLYLLAVLNIKLLGIITPFGGICFLAGWAVLIRAAVTNER